MVKLIGIKELQKSTKKVREEVAKGNSFIVVYRSKPVFEIKPLDDHLEFADSMAAAKVYNENFLKRMSEAEEEVKKGKLNEYTTEEFLNSLD